MKLFILCTYAVVKFAYAGTSPLTVGKDEGPSILKRMAQLYNIYRFVKITEKVATELEKADPHTESVRGEYKYGEPNVIDVKRRFKRNHSWSRNRSTKYTKSIFVTAKEKGYLTEHIRHVDRIPIHVIHIEIKGRDLMRRSVFSIWPKGLWLTWVDENYKASTLIIAFLGGVVIGIISIVLSR
jgi:hypothetical protein